MSLSSGRIWIISGPSGVGKGTVCTVLAQQHPEIFISVSATTRRPRPGEVPGKSYHFVDSEHFERMIADGELLEYAVVHGNHHYGTPRGPVVAASQAGRPVVLEIDLQGARQVKENLPEAQLVFLVPPSWDELVTRLSGRGTEKPQDQARRLVTARAELAARDEADHLIVNGKLEETVATLVSLMGL